MAKKCKDGKKCGDTCISALKTCQVRNGANSSAAAAGMADKIRQASFNFDKKLAEGAYGTVELDSKNNVVRKTLKKPDVGFGKYELALGEAMGEAGFSPRVYGDLSNDRQIVMDVAPGKTLWKDYRQDKDSEPESMTEAQAANAMRAIKYLHKDLGFAHGDNHILQYLIEGDSVKLIDFGLSERISDSPKKALQDWSKMYKAFGMDRFKDSEEFGDIVDIVDEYRAVKGKSKKAETAREEIYKKYMDL